MRRHLRTIILFLVLGAVVNVGVAWSMPGPSPDDESFVDRSVWIREPATVATWSVMRWNGTGCTMLVAQAFALGGSIEPQVIEDKRLPGWSRLHELPHCEQGRWLMRHDIAFGWPLRSTYMYQDTEMSQTTATATSQVLHGAAPEVGLPYYILPLGFSLNTLFYGLLLWCSILTWSAVRWLRRRRRGLCIHCGYDLRGTAHERCPECGGSVGVQKAATS